MKKTRNGIRTLALLLCAALAALTLGGCRDSAAAPSAPDGGESSASSAETPAAETTLLDTETVAGREAVYGKPLAETLAAFGLSEADVTYNEALSAYDLNAPVTRGGVEWAANLQFDFTANIFYAWQYRWQGEAAQAAALAEQLMPEATELYGEPTTYPDASYSLTYEGALDGVREGGAARLFDTWLAGEWTRFELHLDGLGDGTASVQLLYTFNADRNDPATLERWQELVDAAAAE